MLPYDTNGHLTLRWRSLVPGLITARDKYFALKNPPKLLFDNHVIVIGILWNVQRYDRFPNPSLSQKIDEDMQHLFEWQSHLIDIY
jgi:hypothetical protein